VQLTGGVGLSGAARALAAGPLGLWEGEADWLGPEMAQPRGGRVFFLFLFLFSISHFYFVFPFLFISFSFEQKFAN
jgi:hypothetical protein